MYKKNLGIAGIVFAFVMLSGCTASAEEEKSEGPEVITVWSYYNGPQKEAFDRLVEEFNETEGKDKEIVIKAVSKGTLEGLNQAVSDSAEEKIASEKLPQLAFAYADTALELDQKGLLADIRQYLSDEEVDSYVNAYMEEGQFSDDGAIKILPTAKATEVLTVNLTAWEPFAAETGADLAQLSTWEGVVQISEQYYQWTDEKTPEPEDGKAFFGRDAMANYMLSGSAQLGHDILQVEDGKMKLDFNKEAMHKLWDAYYLPYIKGYYIGEGKFRSGDLKVGNLVAYVGSTSGALYTPDKVIYEDGSTEDIVCDVLPVPNFEGTEPMAVQQGGGMMLFKSEEKTEKAAVEFMKWFTNAEENMEFCLETGYLPVRKAANSVEVLDKAIEETQKEIPEILRLNLLTAMEEVNKYQLYTTKPFSGGSGVRGILGSAITEYAAADREAVKKMLKEGLSVSEAVEELKTEARFEQWYQETNEKLKGFSE